MVCTRAPRLPPLNLLRSKLTLAGSFAASRGIDASRTVVAGIAACGLIKRSPLCRRKTPLFGRRKFFERKLAQARRIAHSGLRNFHDRFGDGFGVKVRSICVQCAERSLVRRYDALDFVRTESRMLQ